MAANPPSLFVVQEGGCHMRDFRYALRVLWRSPAFTAVAVLSLALGIGANTGIFTVSWVLFSQPLAVHDPDHLLAITNRMTIPRGMRGMYQINGSSYRDPESGLRWCQAVNRERRHAWNRRSSAIDSRFTA